MFQYYFTVNFTHENQKALELRTEDIKDGDEWVAAITHARYQASTTSALPSQQLRQHTHGLLLMLAVWLGLVSYCRYDMMHGLKLDSVEV